jgi:Domain of unknown function (DUF5915)
VNVEDVDTRRLELSLPAELSETNGPGMQSAPFGLVHLVRVAGVSLASRQSASMSAIVRTPSAPEGQKVRIDLSVVSFVESIPEYVVEEPFQGGVVYLDTRMSKELIAEGYAKEIANLVREARKDMRLADDRIVELELVAGRPFRAMVQPWKDMILRDSNALDPQFVDQPDANAYVIEAGLGQETFLLGIRAAEM